MIDIPVIPPVIKPFGLRIEVIEKAINKQPMLTNMKSTTFLLKSIFFKISPPLKIITYIVIVTDIVSHL